VAAKKKKKKTKAELLHMLDQETGYHQDKGGGNGGCLTRHVSPYDDKDACSHRHQGYLRACEFPTWYNWPAYESLSRGNRTAWRPTRGEWDLTGSGVGSRTERGVRKQSTFPNFQGHAMVPYWHNAHHIIPNGVINDSLLDAAKSDMNLFYLVRAGLLEAQYSVNDKLNMVLLPMDTVVAAALCLPCHIADIEVAPGKIKKQRKHQIYSDQVKAQVDDVIKDYASQLDTKKHDADLPAFTKAKLERISKRLFIKLKMWAAMARGGALDVAPPKVYR